MEIKQLSSRERVRLALNHQEPDRVPMDVTYTSQPYIDVRKELGLPPQVITPDVWDTVKPTSDVVNALSCDFMWVGLRGGSKRQKFSFDLDEYTTEWGVTFRKVQRVDGGFQFEMREHPIEEPSMDNIDTFAWPDPLDPARYEGLEDTVSNLYKTTDFAICAKLGGNIWEMGNYLTGQEKWLIYFVLYPDFCVELLQRVAEYQKTLYIEGLKRIGKYLSVVRLSGEDFGTQGGLLISPNMFRSLVKPILQDVYMTVKECLADLGNYDCKLMLHSCGGIEPLIDDFIEMGVDILDPVQTRAKRMNALHLKQAYGDRISFHGGIDTQGILPFGTVEDVVEETRRKLECFAPGGGYILCPTHNVQADVSGRNIITMILTGLEFGTYPIKRTMDNEYLLNLDY
jgi:uroporphyrinogen decarboxylase